MAAKYRTYLPRPGAAVILEPQLVADRTQSLAYDFALDPGWN